MKLISTNFNKLMNIRAGITGMCVDAVLLGTTRISSYQIHIGCARKRGRIMHILDEHQLYLMFPPVKGHPHDFSCERYSEDINPIIWIYLCHKCDTSFHADSLNQGRWSNIKFGAIVKDDTLHHGLKITPAEPEFKCGSCGK
ncbi:hypothetical protein DCAR_0830828 [Daucus carota subsp. sativus]|uniref:Uncharacterized protein n=1 Tax=Daucus carota subsp. sativus TaxID=79200 RepID=A0A175YK51_DAUCS|nr:hypothetical protein DCAR_0830828 [Daucus carota subsp. sativus]